MKLTQLLYFKTVAEMGKISLAAKKLYISPPAMSIAIANLEKELGVKLFDRANNKIILNEQGKKYLQHVNQILDDLSLAQKDIQSMQHDEEIVSSLSDET